MPHFYWDHAASQSTNRGSPKVTKNPGQVDETNCLIRMEACAGAHFLARVLMA
jgi:hypothetical protein